MDGFNALQSLGFHLQQKDSDLRRSIKFDDQNYNLVMDVMINNFWKRISAEQAKDVAKANPEVSSGPNLMETKDITDLLGKK